jgi:drug/metabolite transporter (DMT)-like permease
MKAPVKSYAAVVFAELCWGFSFIWTQQLAGEQQIPVFVLIFIRMLISAVAMTVISLAVGSRLKVDRQDVKWFLLLAFFEPFLYFIGETFGIKATNSPTLSALIIAVIPIVTMFADILFYKTKLAAIAKFGVLLTLPGTLLMVLKKDPSTSVYWWGIALLMLAVFSSCGYSITVRRLVDKYSAITINTWQFCIGAVFFLPFFLLTKGDFPVMTLFQAPAIGPLLCLAILCSCGAFSCYVFALKHIGITRACIFSATIPIVSATASYFMGIETFSWLELLGIAVVIAGVILAQRGGSRPIAKDNIND